MNNGTFDLGNVLLTGERIKSARQRRNILSGQEARASRAEQRAMAAEDERRRITAAQESRTQAKFDEDRMLKNSALLYQAASDVKANPAAVDYYLPVLKRNGIIKDDYEIGDLTPEQIQQEAADLQASLEPELKSRGILKRQQDGTLGVDPLYAIGPRDETAAFQLSKSGPPTKVVLPEGYTLREPVKSIDYGGGKALYGSKTGAPRGNIKETLSPSQELGYVGQAAESKQIGKARAEARMSLPQAISTAEDMISAIDDQIADPDTKYITGWYSKAPTVPNTGMARARGRHKQILGKVFLEAYKSLRGGGQITQIEGEKGQDAIARMNTAQKYEDYIAALNDLKGVVRRGIQRAKEEVNIGAPRGEQAGPAAGAAQGPGPGAGPGAEVIVDWNSYKK